MYTNSHCTALVRNTHTDNESSKAEFRVHMNQCQNYKPQTR